jgi:hypothetical protein
MKKTFKHKWLLLIAATVILAACGGSDSYKAPDVKPPVVPVCVAPQVLKDNVCVTPEPMVDAFFKYVGGLLAMLFDDKEPVAITDVTVTTPENTEPEAVK